jgi:hypothetical protein
MALVTVPAVSQQGVHPAAFDRSPVTEKVTGFDIKIARIDNMICESFIIEKGYIDKAAA